MATHLIPSCRLADVEASLATVRSSRAEELPGLINRLLMNFAADQPSLDPPSFWPQQAAWIREAFAPDNLHEIFRRLENMKDNDWAIKLRQEMQSHSPTALWITLEVLRAANRLTLKGCLQLDAELAHRHMTNPALADFYEGVRAKLVAKTGQPKWSPASLLDLDVPALTALLHDALRHPQVQPPWIFDRDYEQYPHRQFALPSPLLLHQAFNQHLGKGIKTRAEMQAALLKAFGGPDRLGLAELIEHTLQDHLLPSAKLEWKGN